MPGVLSNPAAFIYGMVTIGTLPAAQSPTRDTYPRTVCAVIIAILLH